MNKKQKELLEKAFEIGLKGVQTYDYNQNIPLYKHLIKTGLESIPNIINIEPVKNHIIDTYLINNTNPQQIVPEQIYLNNYTQPEILLLPKPKKRVVRFVWEGK